MEMESQVAVFWIVTL